MRPKTKLQSKDNYLTENKGDTIETMLYTIGSTRKYKNVRISKFYVKNKKAFFVFTKCLGKGIAVTVSNGQYFNHVCLIGNKKF